MAGLYLLEKIGLIYHQRPKGAQIKESNRLKEKKPSAPASLLSHLTFYSQRYFQLFKAVSLVFTFILLVRLDVVPLGIMY